MEPVGKRIVITGGAGFIGSAIARRLIADNQVVVFDDFSRDALTGSSIWTHPNLTVVRGSVLVLVAVL